MAREHANVDTYKIDDVSAARKCRIMEFQTITLARPQLLPSNPECDCCAGHLLEALRGRKGVSEAQLDDTALVMTVDPSVVADTDAEQLAREAGRRISARYAHPVFAVEGMDCADCARTLERGVARLHGVHYAVVNFAAAKLRLEYDREQTSVQAIDELARRLGYTLRDLPTTSGAAPATSQVFVCSVEGMCCAAEAGPIEQVVRKLPGVAQVVADPALARLAVTFDPQALGESRIVAEVEQLGFRVVEDRGPRTEDRGPKTSDQNKGDWPLAGSLWSLVSRRPKDLLTALCGLLFASAWLSGLAGAPAGVTSTLYILATLVGGAFVARAGWATLQATHTLDINLLMTVAAIGALLIGEYAEGAAVVFLFALGNALEGYTMERARRSIRALMRLAPDTARVLRPAATGEMIIPVEQVRVGETIVVRPGDRVPLDATVLAGDSAVDQAPITGESVPVAKAAGDELFAGSINGEGALEARVTRPARDSTLARIIHMVEEAQARKSRAQRFIDVFAKYYTPAVIAFAVLVAVLPPLVAGGGWGEWLYRALVLLVIACPCALVISTPVSVVSAISAAARAGVLFKGGAALEAAGGLKALAFDKTGTLTVGRPIVTDIVLCSEFSVLSYHNVSNELPPPLSATEPPDALGNSKLNTQNLELLRLAAAVEQRSTHPLARAILAAAEARGLAPLPAHDFRSIGGRGASATVDGRSVMVGNRAMFAGAELPAGVEERLGELERAGRTAMLVGVDGQVVGLIGAADQPRAESRAVVEALKRQGITRVAMLTGDAAPVAAQVGAAVGVDDVRAGLLPADKLDAIGSLAAQHSNVGMVGDGVNDAPALARATVGIAMGGAGSDAALETADVTLMSDDLAKLPFAIELSRSARQIILQNVVFALAVKAVFLVATLLGAATLWMAVFADTGAALIVIANGMRLLAYRPRGLDKQT
jgi:Cd2+/Zn2+-exporting ATPase